MMFRFTRLLTALCACLLLASCSNGDPEQRAQPGANKPQTGAGGPEASSTDFNGDPKQLVQQMAEFYEQAKTVQVTCRTTTTMQGGGMDQKATVTMTVAAEKPNRLAIRMTGGMMGSDIISDGNKMYTYLPALKTYTEDDAPAGYNEFFQGAGMGSAMGGGLGVFVLQLLADDPYGNVMEGVTSTEYVGKETLDGHDVHHLRFTQEQFDWEMWVRADGAPTPQQLALDMSKALGAMAGAMGGQGAEPPKMKITMVKQYEDWKFDETIAADTFAFQPPADAKLTDNLMESLAGRGRKEEPKSPLIGQPAPPAELDLLDGGKLDLQSHVNKDIVILDFWATWCPPCRKEMPVVAEVARQYRDRGVVFYAVNLQEDRETIQQYLDQAQLDVKVALDTTGSVGTAFGARSIPLLVVIDKTGVVRSVHTGFSQQLRDDLVREIDELLADGNGEAKPQP